jgi:hypothetical protein
MFGFGKKNDNTNPNSTTGGFQPNSQGQGGVPQGQGGATINPYLGQNPLLQSQDPSVTGPNMQVPPSPVNIQPGSFDPSVPSSAMSGTPEPAPFPTTFASNFDPGNPGTSPADFPSPGTQPSSDQFAPSSGFDFNNPAPSPTPQPTAAPSTPAPFDPSINNPVTPPTSPTPASPTTKTEDVESILNEIQTGKTFSIENYSFGYDAGKAAQGTPYWEKGPQGQVYGDKNGLQEFLEEQDAETLKTIKEQLSSQTPQPIPSPVPSTAPESNIASSFPAANDPAEAAATIPVASPEGGSGPNLGTPMTDTNNLGNYDRAKLQQFVNHVNQLNEAKKIIEDYLGGK